MKKFNGRLVGGCIGLTGVIAGVTLSSAPVWAGVPFACLVVFICTMDWSKTNKVA